METKTKIFHKLVRNNRKKGTHAITELSANGKDYKGEENVVKAFQDHFRKLATFNLQGKIDSPYHNMVEEDIETLDELARNRNVTAVSADEITKAIKFRYRKENQLTSMVSQLSIPSSQEVK
jgi:hypothetical protein